MTPRSLGLAAAAGDAVTADHPSAVVLQRDGRRTRITWNPEAAPRDTVFSDGRVVSTPARALSASRDPVP